MAISHLCCGCGNDLARDPARLDREYGLWVVACPECGRAAARSVPRMKGMRRRRRRLRAAMGLVLVQVLAWAVILVTWGVICYGFGHVFDRAGIPAWQAVVAMLPGESAFDGALERGLGQEDAIAAIIGVLGSLACGVWLVMGHRHVGRARALGVFAAAMVVFMNLDMVYVGATRTISLWLGARQADRFASEAEWFSRIQVLALMLGVCAVGMVPGLMLRRSWDGLVQMGRRGMMRRARRARGRG